METRKSKKSFKKKALLSSLSMLMVATVAVGSATFAWFTNNKTVTADGMKVTAAAATGLQITNDNGKNWKPTVSFTDLLDSNITVSPVSLSYSTSDATPDLGKLGTPYYPVTAKADGPLYLSGDNANSSKFEDWTAVTTMPNINAISGTQSVGNNDNFVAYKVGIKSTGADIGKDGNLVKGKVKYTGLSGQEYVRIAVLENETTDIGKDTSGNPVYTVGTTNWKNDTVKQVYGNEPTANAVVTDGPTVAPQVAPSGTGVEFTIGTGENAGILEKGKVMWYTVLIWFEGQDQQCVDANQSISYGNIAIEFSYA